MSDSILYTTGTGTQIWYIPNERKKEGPTDETIGGYKFHKLDGPAYISDIETRYYSNGKLHRYKGPAIISNEREVNPKTDYYIGGNQINVREYEIWLNDSGIDLDDLDEIDRDSIDYAFGQPQTRQNKIR